MEHLCRGYLPTALLRSLTWQPIQCHRDHIPLRVKDDPIHRDKVIRLRPVNAPIFEEEIARARIQRHRCKEGRSLILRLPLRARLRTHTARRGRSSAIAHPSPAHRLPHRGRGTTAHRTRPHHAPIRANQLPIGRYHFSATRHPTARHTRATRHPALRLKVIRQPVRHLRLGSLPTRLTRRLRLLAHILPPSINRHLMLPPRRSHHQGAYRAKATKHSTHQGSTCHAPRTQCILAQCLLQNLPVRIRRATTRRRTAQNADRRSTNRRPQLPPALPLRCHRLQHPRGNAPSIHPATKGSNPFAQSQNGILQSPVSQHHRHRTIFRRPALHEGAVGLHGRSARHHQLHRVRLCQRLPKGNHPLRKSRRRQRLCIRLRRKLRPLSSQFLRHPRGDPPLRHPPRRHLASTLLSRALHPPARRLQRRILGKLPLQLLAHPLVDPARHPLTRSRHLLAHLL